MSGFKVEDIKSAARGRWLDILTTVGGFKSDDLNGRHGPCPMCKEGKDCFRAFNDFAETGGVYCNKCHDHDNGDGISALQRMTGKKFPEVLQVVAEFLNMSPSTNGHHLSNGHAVANTCKAQEPTQIDSVEPAKSGVALFDFEQLARTFRKKFTPYGESNNPAGQQIKRRGFQKFAESKPPIQAESLYEFGALYGSYLPGTSWSLECIAVPGYLRPDDPGPTGWNLRRVDGKDFSAYGNCEPRKTRNIKGSNDSWSFPCGWSTFQNANVVWVCEGFPDAAAIFPHLPEGHTCVTNLSGAKSIPKDLRLFIGKTIYRMADSDDPGILGAAKFAAKVQPFADQVKVVVVPYEVTKDHGRDVRDFLGEGRPFSELLDLADQAPEFVRPKKKTTAEQNCERINEIRKTRPPVDPFLDVFLPEGRTDVANARRLILKYGTTVLYCHEWRKWLVWDQTNWQVDKSGAMVRLGKAVADAVWAEVGWNPGDDAAVAFGVKTSGSNGITAMLRLAESEVSVAVSELDANPWLLNCPNGTVDLRTGHLNAHRREDSITKICQTNFRPDAASYHFDRFLESTFGDQTLIDFVQRWFGYCLTGSVKEQIMAVFHGVGSNGKSTLLNAIQFAIGDDFVNTAPASLLMEKRQETHPTELADLFGRRLVIATETNQGAKLAESTVKSLTGGDVIAARRMREDFWTFNPTHKLVLLTNHKPRITGTDHAIWRRLVLVPFNFKFWNPAKGESGLGALKQDKELPAKLEAEAEGILAWMVRGCLEWQRNGLQIPSVVQSATAEYRSESDTIGRFIAECCLTGQAYRVKFAGLYERLESWCNDSGDNLPSRKAVGQYLREHDFKDKASGVVWYLGIAIRDFDTRNCDESAASETAMVE